MTWLCIDGTSWWMQDESDCTKPIRGSRSFTSGWLGRLRDTSRTDSCPDKTAGQIVSGDSRTVWDGSTLDDTLCEVKKRDSSAFLLGDTQEHLISSLLMVDVAGHMALCSWGRLTRFAQVTSLGQLIIS
jgi:hypothetical protein